MACVSSSGELSPAARKILLVVAKPANPEEIARETGLPLFRVRSGLREMAQAKLVEERSGDYVITDAGRKVGEERGASPIAQLTSSS